MVAGLDEGWDLVTPGVGVLWPAVAEDDGVSGVLPAGLIDLQCSAVDGDLDGVGESMGVHGVLGVWPGGCRRRSLLLSHQTLTIPGRIKGAPHNWCRALSGMRAKVDT